MNIIGNHWEQAQSEDRINLVFENRNKAYGAYQLRKNYLRNKIIGMLSAPLILALLCLLAFMPNTQAFGVKQHSKLHAPVADTVWIEEEVPPLQSASEKQELAASSSQSDVPLINPLAPADLLHGLYSIGAPNGEGYALPFGGLGDNGDKPTFEAKPDTAVYNKPDKSCQFLAYGGEFNRFVEDLFDPNQGCDEGLLSGYAEVRFMVDRLGQVSKVSIIETNVSCDAFTREIEKVFLASPRWSPAMKKGKFVNAWHSIRVEMEF